MKKIVLLPLFLGVFGFLVANSPEDINKEIDQLKKEIHDHRVHEGNLNLNAQEYMFGQPGKYAESMKKMESIDKEIDTLQKKIDDLKAEHDRLLLDVKPAQP